MLFKDFLKYHLCSSGTNRERRRRQVRRPLCRHSSPSWNCWSVCLERDSESSWAGAVWVSGPAAFRRRIHRHPTSALRWSSAGSASTSGPESASSSRPRCPYCLQPGNHQSHHQTALYTLSQKNDILRWPENFCNAEPESFCHAKAVARLLVWGFFPSLPFTSHLPLSSPNPASESSLGARCELPQQGLGQNPSSKRIWGTFWGQETFLVAMFLFL